MKRRVALKNMALAMGGLVALPPWAQAWNKESVQLRQALLTARQEELLAAVVDTIIPETDTPGAKALQVHRFVHKIVVDCYEPQVQDNFRRGLDLVDRLARQTHNAAFESCTAAQRLALLQQLEQAPAADQQAFFALVKKLTVQGYTTSEYVMTRYYNYKMAPGHYHGCVPVQPLSTQK